MTARLYRLPEERQYCGATIIKTPCNGYHQMIFKTVMKDRHRSREDETLATLLNLNGEVFPMENGYWTKFDVWLVDPEPHIPHGVRYSLSLHDRCNRRILGFDNAHAIRPAKKVTPPGKSPGIIVTTGRKYYPMNMNRPANCWRISGLGSRKSLRRNERKQHESKSAPYRHHVLSGL